MSSNKGLQKFTQFEEALKGDIDVTSLVELLNSFNDHNRELLVSAVIGTLDEELNGAKKESLVHNSVEVSYVSERANKLMEVIKVFHPEEKMQVLEREVKTHNRGLVFNAIERLATTGDFPSATKIAKETGISRTTVHKYLKELPAETDPEKQATYKVLADKAKMTLYNLGINENNVKALTAFLKYAQPPQKGTTNNYIQINNTTITVDQLLPEQQEELKGIILNYISEKQIQL